MPQVIVKYTPGGATVLQQTVELPAGSRLISAYMAPERTDYVLVQPAHGSDNSHGVPLLYKNPDKLSVGDPVLVRRGPQAIIARVVDYPTQERIDRAEEARFMIRNARALPEGL